jgi:hypothetical protein
MVGIIERKSGLREHSCYDKLGKYAVSVFFDSW